MQTWSHGPMLPLMQGKGGSWGLCGYRRMSQLSGRRPGGTSTPHGHCTIPTSGPLLPISSRSLSGITTTTPPQPQTLFCQDTTWWIPPNRLPNSQQLLVRILSPNICWLLSGSLESRSSLSSGSAGIGCLFVSSSLYSGTVARIWTHCCPTQ